MGTQNSAITGPFVPDTASMDASIDAHFDGLSTAVEAGGGAGSGDGGGTGEPTTAVEVAAPAAQPPAATDDGEPLVQEAADPLADILKDLEEEAPPPAGDPKPDAKPAEAKPAVKPAEPAPAAKEGETDKAADVPEGVVVRPTKGGGKEWIMTEERGRNLAASHQIVQKAEAVLGEQLTPEALQARQDVFEDFHGMLRAVKSKDPKRQGAVLSYFLESAREAKEAGLVAHDPLATLGQSIIEAITPHREVDAALATHYGNDFIDYLYQLGMERNTAGTDKNLLLAVKHIEKAIRGKARTQEQLTALASRPAQDPTVAVSARMQEVEEREAGLAKREWDGFLSQTTKAVGESVQTSIKEAIGTEHVQRLEKVPEVMTRVSERLQEMVSKTIAKDQKFRREIATLYEQAQDAGRPDVRIQAREEILKRYSNKARLIVTEHRRAIIEEEVARHKGLQQRRMNRVEQTTARRPASSTPGAPVAPGAPAAAGGEGFLSRDQLEREMDSFFDSMAPAGR